MALFQKSVLNQYLKDLDKTKVTNAYTLFKAHFHNTTIQQHIRESKEEQYQGEFLIDLFVNVLGYTKNPQPNFNLQTEQKNETNSKKADGAILKDGNVLAVIELKGTNTTDLNTVTQQAFGYKNNQKNCKYIIISNFEKLRFYIDNAIDFEEFNLFTLTENEFTLLYLCLHYENLLNDLPNKIKQASTVKEENITKQLYKDYSDLKRKLFADIVHLNPQYDKLILFKKSQKLLDRILFILFAEDRNLIPVNTIHTILTEWQQLQKLNVNVPLYDRFKNHFNYLNVGFKNDAYEVYGYNGGLFAEDEILDTIKISDNLLQNYVPILSKYDYETDVDVNILGHIFEHSLNDIEEIQAELDGTAIDKTKTKRKKDGVFYTPKYITKYIVENTVGALCTEKRNEYGIIADNYTPDKRKAKKKELLQTLDTYQNWLLQITIVDPACGSGAFLNQALDFLIQEHKSIDELRAQLLGHSFVLPDHEIEILENNIFGVDLNEESVEIARLSLWLRTARKGRKLNSLNNNIKCGNSLIDDVNIAGEKAFNWQKEFPKIFERGGFDVVIGNPPYVAGKDINQNQKDFYKSNFEFISGKYDLYILFLERITKIANKKYYWSLIIPNTFLANENASLIRKELLKYKSLKSIRVFNDEIFADASVESVIPICCNHSNNNIQIIDNHENTISYIDSEQTYQEKFSRFQISISKSDDNILNKIEVHSVKLGSISDICIGIQIGGAGNSSDFKEKYITKEQKDSNYKKCLDGKNFEPFLTNWSGNYIQYGDWLHRKRNEMYFINPKIMIRQIGNTPVSNIDFEGYYTLNTIYNLIITNFEFDIRTVFLLINSKLIKYYWLKKFSDTKDLFPKIKKSQLVEIPIFSNYLQQPFIEKADIMLQKNKELQTIKTNFIKVLQSQYATHSMGHDPLGNKKLSNWNELSFKDFCKELEKQKIKLTLSEKAELLQYFETEQAKANTIQQTITQTDKEIDAMVYKLYELTDEEIAIVENN